MKNFNNSVFNAKAFAMFTVKSTNENTSFTDRIAKESLRRSAKALQESGQILQEKRKYKEYVMQHGSLNQAINAFFDFN